MEKRVIAVIGAGLAGSEAAWQLAERGFQVQLHEMRPTHLTPAHHTGMAAEMVCSNSFKSDDPFSATGILKEELATLGCKVLQVAQAHRVPAGMSLAVDREAFSEAMTVALRQHPNISWIENAVEAPEPGTPTILATGPLTSSPLAEWISRQCGTDRLYFYDAIAPIVEADSIDLDIAFRASRYDKGTADFLNCPLNQPQYEAFLDSLCSAPRAPLHDFEINYFEACLPIEVMAERGRETLRFGPMKPVGLTDPRSGRWPYAAVQLRQDTLAGDHYNLVGFQTRLTWGAQADVFRMIPGLQHASFARFGSIHRNTYVCAPAVLDATGALKGHPHLWIAGQLSGVEGYLESAASGLAVSRFVADIMNGRRPVPFPRDTMLGALLHHLSAADPSHFAPVNAMLGLLPPLDTPRLTKAQIHDLSGGRGPKRARAALHRARALQSLSNHLEANP